MAERTLIVHERSMQAVAEDNILLASMLGVVFLSGFVVWWCLSLPAPDMLSFVMAGGFAILLVAGFVFEATQKLRTGGQFRCVLTTERLICECPFGSHGESFALKIDEIKFIEIKQSLSSNFGGDYYLHDLKGREYLLTLNYCNPVVRILARLEELNPKIKLINQEISETE